MNLNINSLHFHAKLPKGSHIVLAAIGALACGVQTLYQLGRTALFFFFTEFEEFGWEGVVIW